MPRKEKEEKESPASTGGAEETMKKTKEKLITAIGNKTNNTKLNRNTIDRKQKWRKNNSMDISSVKLTKSPSRTTGHV